MGRALWLKPIRGVGTGGYMRQCIASAIWAVAVSGILYCDEEPEIRPQNFGVNDDTVDSSSAEFYWDAVDDDPLQVHGIFRGYQVSRFALQNLILSKMLSEWIQVEASVLSVLYFFCLRR